MSSPARFPVETTSLNLTKDIKTKNVTYNTETIEYVYNPISKKHMKRDSSAISNLISKNIISYSGQLLVTKEELDDFIRTANIKKAISTNRIDDAIDLYLPKMNMVSLYLLMKKCEEQIKSPQREDDYNTLLQNTSNTLSLTEEITKMRISSSNNNKNNQSTRPREKELVDNASHLIQTPRQQSSQPQLQSQQLHQTQQHNNMNNRQSPPNTIKSS